MATGQRYLGKGGTTTLTERTGENSPQTATSKAEATTLLHNREFYEQCLDCAHQSITDELSVYFDEGVDRQVKAVNQLLFHWLTTTPDINLAAGEPDHQHLFTTLELVNFLTELHSKSLFAESVRADLEAAKLREVSHE